MTKPSKLQEQAAARLVLAVTSAAEAHRLDGGPKPSTADFREAVQKLARLSTPCSADELLARALDERGKAMKMSMSAGELVMLVESPVETYAAMLLGDEEFRAHVAALEATLGEV